MKVGDGSESRSLTGTATYEAARKHFHLSLAMVTSSRVARLHPGHEPGVLLLN